MNNYIKSFIYLLLLVGLVGCSRMSPEERFAEAQTLFQQEKFEQALISAKQLVSEVPRDPEYRVFLAELQLLDGNLDAAQKEFQRALEYGIDLSTVSASQVDLELFRNNYADAFELLLERQGAFKDKDMWNAYLAVTTLVTGDAELLQTALAYLNKQGQQYADFVAAAQFINSRKPAKAADVLLASSEQIIAPEILFVLGTTLVESGIHPAAQAVLERYTEQRPQNRIANYFLARSYLATNDEVKARPQIDIVRQDNGNNALGQYIDAVYHYQTGQVEMAAELAQQSLDGGINNPISYFIVGVNAFKQENFERALSAFEYLNQVSPSNTPIKRMLSAVQLRLGDVVSASQSITGIGEADADDIDLILLTGFRAIQSSHSDDVLTELTRFARGIDTSDIGDSLGLALLNFADDDEQGILQLEQVFNSDPQNTNAFALLATAYVQSGSIEKAEKLVSQILTDDSELSITSREIVANVFLQLGKLDQAEQQYATIRQLESERASVLMFDVVSAEAKRDYNAAISAAQRYVNLFPENLKGFLKLAELLDTTAAQPSVYDSMYSQLEQIGNPEHQLFLANKLISAAQFQRAKAVLTALTAPAAQSKKSTMLGYIALEDSNADEALTHVDPILALEPNNIRALEIALRANALTDNLLLNNNLIDKALLIEPNNSAIHYLKAINLIAQEDYLAAQAILDPIIAENDQLALRALQGKIHLGNRQFEKAYPYMLEAYNAGPTRSRLLDLVATLNGLNKPTERSMLLDSYLKSNPNEIEIRMLQAEYTLRENTQAGATALEAIIADYPENVVALNNLAYAYLQLGKLTEASNTIDKALVAKPNTLAFVLSKSRILIAQGKTEQGLSNLASQINLKTGQPSKYVFDYLHMLLDAGDIDSAQFYFDQYRLLGLDKALMNRLERRLNSF